MLKGNFSIANKIKCFASNLSLIIVILSLKAGAQTTDAATRTYINSYAKDAVNEMIEHKIPASVILAQAIFESGCGNSVLAKKSNNHFGIKCHTQWDGDTIRKSDDSLNECFRRYNSVKESYEDHSLFLTSRARYKHLFNLPVNNFKGWCYGLKNAGYATYAFYPEVLIKIIEEFELYKFDRTESLPSGSILVAKNQTIIESKLIPTGFSLKQLSAHDLLWSDERHLLIQSLEMIVDNPNKETDGIADN